eukprot:181243-Prymnesium_polylepis.1
MAGSPTFEFRRISRTALPPMARSTRTPLAEWPSASSRRMRSPASCAQEIRGEAWGSNGEALVRKPTAARAGSGRGRYLERAARRAAAQAGSVRTWRRMAS